MVRLRFLIAARNNQSIEIASKILQFHYEESQCDFARSAEELESKASSDPFDLILIDSDIFEKNRVIESLRLKGVETPLILLIETGEEIKAIEAIEMGASDYVFKEPGYLSTLPFNITSYLHQRSVPAQEVTQKTAVRIYHQTNSKDDSSFVLDRKGRILSTNRQIESLTRFSGDELKALSFFDLLPNEQEKLFNDILHSIKQNGHSQKTFKTEILDRIGNRIYVDMVLTGIKDKNKKVFRYRGTMESTGVKPLAESDSTGIDQLEMVKMVSRAITSCYDEPLNVFMDKIVAIASRIFQFQCATLALLDKRKRVFVKQALIGYNGLTKTTNGNGTVPEEVIQRIFANTYRVKAIYDSHGNDTAYVSEPSFKDRRTQRRRPSRQWHKRDLLLVNLPHRNASSIGYLSLDKPIENRWPEREVFHNLELFGQLVAFGIENYYQFSSSERRSRRLKQILVTSNIFKLHLNLNDLLKEVAWTIKHSLGFNLVALGLISKKSEKLELRAVACEDKIKQNQLSHLTYSLKEIEDFFRNEYKIGKSYLISKEEIALTHFKQIYYGPAFDKSVNGSWQNHTLLLTPIRSKDDKIIGLLIADDPVAGRIPTDDVFHTFEIMANQIAIAIDNRILYAKAKHRIQQLETRVLNDKDAPSESSSKIKELFDKLFT